MINFTLNAFTNGKTRDHELKNCFCFVLYFWHFVNAIVTFWHQSTYKRMFLLAGIFSPNQGNFGRRIKSGYWSSGLERPVRPLISQLFPQKSQKSNLVINGQRYHQCPVLYDLPINVINVWGKLSLCYLTNTGCERKIRTLWIFAQF